MYQASTVARDQAVAYLDSIGKNHEFLSPEGTDAISFNNVGIPASGVLTGQDCCKTQQEVDLFGGQTGNYEGNLGTTDDGSVHQRLEDDEEGRDECGDAGAQQGSEDGRAGEAGCGEPVGGDQR